MLRQLVKHYCLRHQLALINRRLCQSSSASSLPVAHQEEPVNLLERKDSAVKWLEVKEALSLSPSSDVVIVQGWISRIRTLKQVYFVDIENKINKEVLQVVVPKDILDSHLTTGSAVAFQGILKECPGRKQSVELLSSYVKVLGECSHDVVPFDLNKSHMNWPVLRQAPHYRHMISNMRNMLKIRSGAIQSVNEYMAKNDYVNITTPIITGNDCEGGGDVFTIQAANDVAVKDVAAPEATETEMSPENDSESPEKDSKFFFSRPAFLSVSGQLHLEAMVNVFPKVYTMSPAFRAEKQLSRRHVSEFVMIEVEHAFVHSLDDIMDAAEDFVRFIANSVQERFPEELAHLQSMPRDTKFSYKCIDRLTSKKKYLRITYEDALVIVNKESAKLAEPLESLKFGDDLKRFHEKLLLKYFEGYPVFVTHYPSSLKAFYMKREGDKCLNFDLLIDVGGEVIGGGIREDDYQSLQNRIYQETTQETTNESDELQDRDKRNNSLDWYVSLRKMGQPPHAGYGLGFDRLLMSITEVGNIRDVIPFPSWNRRLTL